MFELGKFLDLYSTRDTMETLQSSLRNWKVPDPLNAPGYPYFNDQGSLIFYQCIFHIKELVRL